MKKYAGIIALFVLLIFIFGCTLPPLPGSSEGNASAKPQDNRSNVIVTPAGTKVNESRANLSKEAQYSAVYSIKNAVQPYLKEVAIYSKGNKERLDYLIDEGYVSRLGGFEEIRYYIFQDASYECYKKRGAWECKRRDANIEEIRLLMEISAALRSKIRYTLAENGTAKIADTVADCYSLKIENQTMGRSCYSNEGVMLYARILDEEGRESLEIKAKSYRTLVEESELGLPAEVKNEEKKQADPFANFTPRNVSDKIGEGQFRLLPQTAAPLRIYVLNASHADSILITKGEFAMLIDAGIDVSAQLRELGVKKLHVVVATRDYSGAINGMLDVLENFEVVEFWENKVPPKSPEYTAVLEKVKEKGITIKHPEVGDSFEFSGVKFTALNPEKRRLLGNPDGDAIVMKVSFEDFCILLLNPTIQEREPSLMNSGENIRCDVATYFRHGEGRPMPSVLIDRAKVKDVIISVGENEWGLPSNTTLTRFAMAGIRVFRTDLHGTVRVSYDGVSNYEIAIKDRSGKFIAVR
ncbi:MAG: hypothetical protein N3G22_04795 [Candidatus Micrarchaeota archaeon]|nr:hypothetical protein [Candidatus Micrarchaeota archaeon]